MLDKDSAVQWIEANINKIVADCGGTIGDTSRHRYAQHLFEGLSHNYAGPINQEHAAHQKLLDEQGV